LDILHTSRKLGATNARDRVYAFLGNPLAQTDSGLLIDPDYKKSVSEVYLDVARTLLEHKREGPWLLGYAKLDIELPEENERSLPSWTPRWDRTGIFNPIAHPAFWYQAGLGYKDFNAKAEDGNHLAVTGFIFDSVSWVSPHISQQNLLPENDHLSNQGDESGVSFVDALWDAALEATGEHEQDLTQFEDAFSLTLIRAWPRDPSFQSIDMECHRKRFTSYRRMIRAEVRNSSDGMPQEDSHDARMYLETVSASVNRALALTGAGRLGLVSPFAEPKDLCCIILGMTFPVILRKVSGDRCVLIGDAYIHSVMEGEFKEETIVIE
jgi:hypothetical protein